MLNPGLLDRIAIALNATLNPAWTGLTPGVLWILSVVSTIYLCGTLAVAMARMLDVIPQLLIRVAVFMGFVWLVTNFQGLTDLLASVAVSVGLTVSRTDMTATEFALPGRILWLGQGILQPLIDHVNKLSWLDALKNFVPINIIGWTMFLSQLCFMITAIHMLYVQITYKMIVLINFLKIPFGIFSGTAFIAREAVDAILSQMMRLMVLALVIGMTRPMLTWLAFPEGQTPTYWSAFAVLLGAAVMMTLSIAGPRAASVHGGALMGLFVGSVFGAIRGVSWLRR